MIYIYIYITTNNSDLPSRTITGRGSAADAPPPVNEHTSNNKDNIVLDII